MAEQQEIILYGAEWCDDCRRLERILGTAKRPYTYKDIESSQQVMDELLVLTDGVNHIPVIKFGDKISVNPDNAELLKLLEMNPASVATHEVITIGAGPAALTAAIYTTREDIETLLFEKGAIGGLASITDWIDNYPGFTKGVSGLELGQSLQAQAERFGAKIELGEVTKVIDEGKYKLLKTTSGDMYARVVLIATGTDFKKIGVPGEDVYYGRGVHYCATCDGAFYRDKRLVVVGGGNSAVQETIFLTRYASHIDLLVRASTLRASEVLQHDLERFADKVTIHFNTTTDEIIGHDKKVIKAIGTNKISGEKVSFPTDGVFVFIGLEPNTQFLVDSKVALDEYGFIKTDESLHTSVSGIFAAGDVRSGATMQIASAAGEGATAALKIRHYLEAEERTESIPKKQVAAKV